MNISRTTIGLVLLDQINRYMVNGEIPKRPDFDKEFLLKVIKNKVCLASENTIKDLPKSITNSCLEITENGYLNWEVNLGIKTFKEFPPDIFFISRSTLYEVNHSLSEQDKFFDMYWLETKYNRVISHHNLEIWIRK